MILRRRGRHGRVPAVAQLLQQSFLLTVSGGLSAAGGFLAWTVASRSASAHSVGVAAGLVASCSLLSYLTSLALPYGLLRYAHGAGGARILRLALLVTAVTSLLGAAVFVVGSPLWAPSLSSVLAHPISTTIYAAFNVGVAASILVDAYLVSRRRADVACGKNGIVALCKVCVVIALAKAMTLRADDIYLAMLVPVAISALVVATPLAVRRRTCNEGDGGSALSRDFLRFSLNTFPGALLDGAPIFVLPVLALRLVGASAYAHFYVAWSIAGVVGLLSSAVAQVTLREAATQNEHRDLAIRAMGLALGITSLAVLAFYLAAGFTLGVFGPIYVSGVLPLRLLLLSALPGAYLTIVITLLRGRKLYRAVNQASIAYASLSIGAAAAFGTFAGTSGLCLGWLVGVSLSAVAATVISFRYPAELPIAKATRRNYLRIG